ncbi:hypothetical protein PC116_g17760 [Phytophthora cactorum]|uniref:Uncharacterized protein n=1 Tax=Phytophthora cactorum TaxID=29920 RepID=A0A8T1BUP4_9STRA|nr:hypothetical protein Pcac1_g3206 [Phytophthora cactorum]KAG2908977.1 hypothetical protein PC117_g19806 [Phytophthora cactorum]KAG4234064.1 hypothetical protein PC116_g17760 [Phytophthora cactorum]
MAEECLLDEISAGVAAVELDIFENELVSRTLRLL